MLHNGFVETKGCNLTEISENLTRSSLFLQIETSGVQGQNTAHYNLTSFYTQAVNHEVLYEPALIKVHYSPLTLQCKKPSVLEHDSLTFCVKIN